jgi:riboflavin synthase
MCTKSSTWDNQGNKYPFQGYKQWALKLSHLRTALFCVIRQRIVATSYKSFGTTYQGDRQLVPKRRQEIVTNHCLITQNGTDLIYFVGWKPQMTQDHICYCCGSDQNCFCNVI